MTRAVAVLSLVVGLVGCGSTGSPDVLTGNWVIPNDAGTVALDFDGSTYVLGTLQVTGIGTVNAELQKGTFVADSTRVTFTPVEWTCAGVLPPYTLGYSLSNGSLVLEGTDGILAFVPNTAPSGSVQIAYGCFDGMGGFTPRPSGPAR